MRASDPMLHRQLDHFARACRQATASDRVIIVTLFWDDEIGKEATAVSYDMKETDHVVTDLVHTLLSAAATVMGSTPLQLIIKNKQDGTEIPFHVDQPFDASWEEEDG